MPEFDFLKGELLLVDKPLGWTSFDVVNKLRYTIKKKLEIKKIKVGHAGTLDPLATGLLLICTGKMTKEIESLMLQEKEYTGSILLNQKRPSIDFETDVEEYINKLGRTKEELLEGAKSFLGKQFQEPPSFSAKRIDGRRSYELAREGKPVKLGKHEVEIFDFELESIKIPQVDFTMRCSKGTYVRSLARDFGAKFGLGGVLSSLRRTAIGDFKVSASHSLESLVLRINSMEC